MRPLRLIMRAFGPYVGEQRLDFTHFDGQPLFLVHGPTGSGKTTILDAICFALYGEASGSERQAGQLRSQQAAEGMLTEVQLDFRLGDAHYRIRRRPAQQRPKKRGDGFTEEKAKAWLWRRQAGLPEGEDGRLLASSPGEVATRVEQLLGLDAAQFRQVIMLPQGEFRRLLSADSRQREEILERLFGTRLYEDIAECLHQRAKALRADLAALEQQQRGILQASGTQDEQALFQQMAGVDAEYEELSATIEKIEQEEKLAALNLQQAEDVLQRLQRRAEAIARLRNLQDKRPRYEKLQRRLHMAQRAAAVLPVAQARDAAARRQKDSHQQARQATQRLQQARKALRQAEQAHAAATGQASERDALAAEITRLRDLLPRLRKLDALRRREAELREKVAQAEQAARQAWEAAQQAEEELERLQQARQEAAALELARTLREGAPCPVCGSLEHPAPAHARADSPATRADDDVLRQARQRRLAAQRRHDEQQRALNELRRQQAEAGGASGALLEALPEAWRDTAAAEQALHEKQACLDRLDVALQQADQAMRAAREEATSAEATNEAMQHALQRDEEALRAASLALQQALTEAGFADEEDWRNALMDEDERHSRQAELDDWRQQLAAAEALARRAEQEASGLRAPDIDALRQRHEALRGQMREAGERLGELRNRRQALHEAHRQLRQLTQELHVLQQRHDAVNRLAALTRGDNPARMTLHRYVLAALLDEVLAAASERLRIMSAGRYLLLRRQHVADRRRAAGLDLDVMDNFTGEQRPVQTLSGGEGFLAALALALGLADVVQARAGALRMETLFIDEGFGALDAEALDHALQSLMRLKGEKRMVAIISHVIELREQIPAQVEVIPGRGGSHIRLRA